MSNLILWSLLAVLNLVSVVLGVGTAAVYSNCPYDVFFAPTINDTVPMQLLGPSGFQMPYDMNPQNAGVSIKLATSVSSLYGGPISQFEFTWSGDKIYWDLSNINGNGSSAASYPFYQGGINLVPSMANDPSNPTCEPVTCPPGLLVCSAAYNAPDDPRTYACDQNSDLTMTLCPAGTEQVRRQVQKHDYFSSRRHRRLPYA